MRLLRVDVAAFGPLVDTSMEFAPGLNVVVGPNESAKSSWHAAAYAAICGRRRGPGLRLPDRIFQDKHRPWSGAAWRVGAEIELDDGRRVSLVHDLDGGVASQAIDGATGRDISNQIMHDGAPDGSRFLGLDRESFGATATVRQAEMLAILERADGLQRLLEQAAASAGSSDQTAALALTRIEDFRREQVGVDRAGARKPLRRAIDAVRAAKEALERSRADHDGYLELVAEVDLLRADQQEQQRILSGLQQSRERLARLRARAEDAAAARRDAVSLHRDRDTEAGDLQRLRERLGRAQGFIEQLGGSAVEPPPVADHQQVRASVDAAIARWRNLPERLVLTGKTAAELRAELEALPPHPVGDLQPDPEAESAWSRLQSLRGAVQIHTQERPEEPRPDPLVEAALAYGPENLRSLAGEWASLPGAAEGEAHQLEEDRLRAEQGREESRDALNRAQEELGRTRTARDEAMAAAESDALREAAAGARTGRSQSTALYVVAAALAAAGITLIAIGQTVVGLGLVVAAGAAGAAGLVRQRSSRPGGATPAPRPTVPASITAQVSSAQRAVDGAEQEFREAERALDRAADRLDQFLRRQGAARAAREDLAARTRAAGLPEDADQLRTLAAHAEMLRSGRAQFANWSNAAQAKANEVSDTESLLHDLLDGRVELRPGIDATDLDALWSAYRQQCQQRQLQARRASARPGLAEQIRNREAAEVDARRREEGREHARVALVAAARAALGESGGGPSAETDPDDVADRLEAWRSARDSEEAEVLARRTAWSNLQTVLDGETLPDLESREDGLAQEVADLDAEVQRAGLAADQAWHGVLSELADAGLPDATEADAASGLSGLVSDVDDDVRIQFDRKRQTDDRAERAEGRRKERAQRLLAVPDAEEALAAAEAELERVRGLAHVLERTVEYLQAAQDKVYRTIAPTLAETLVRWLPDVTEERYVDARVDPETLAVTVKGSGGTWVKAQSLSFGTSEQVYLLLRIALAHHLGSDTESCPLLLDDVTVQADAVRTVEILETLRSLAEHRQILLFAQDPTVIEWAEALNGSPRHRRIELQKVPAP